MIKNFRTFSLAIDFYRLSSALLMRSHLKEQLTRAASSIALNLAEGQGKRSSKDQARFYQIAFGSVRECQAILSLAEQDESPASQTLDALAAHLYKLLKQMR